MRTEMRGLLSNVCAAILDLFLIGTKASKRSSKTGESMKYKAGDKRKYVGMEMAPVARELLNLSPETFAKYCNGVGSPAGGWFKRLIYKFTPDTIWLLNITPATDIHDVDYTIPRKFKSMLEAQFYREDSDSRLLRNIETLVRRGCPYLYRIRMTRARLYYLLCRNQGGDSFYEDKTIG